ncbi:hypothetical protein K2Z84_21075 [Candidatus Binatia bacterium]|nr:hypothetical protein [Candidatus Binatia bacterium]
MAKKPTSISAKALSSTVSAAVKKLNLAVLEPKVISRPEIIGIILRDAVAIPDALKTAESLAKSVGTAAKTSSALAGLKTLEPVVVITKKGVLAGFFPVAGSPLAF